MKILADENIPLVREAFGLFGEVATAPGRAIATRDVADVDVLLVRSVTQVDAALLSGSAVKFVGTATIGVDHVNQSDLEAMGVGFASCPGSNAESVACYVTCALLELAERLGVRLRGRVLGVVGVGNVGRRVAAKGRALGMEVLLNDPPRAEREGDRGFVSLEELSRRADFVTLHTPLTTDGEHPTYRLFDGESMARLKPGAALLNSGRGDVVDEAALRDALRAGRLGGAALDVWAAEPSINLDTLDLVHVATPHIAGYAIDGKIRGTTMLTEALSGWLERANPWDPEPWLEALEAPVVQIDGAGEVEDVLREVCREANDVMADDRRLRGRLQATQPELQGNAFDVLRKTYPTRREFARIKVEVGSENPPLEQTLKALGFPVRGGQ